MNQTRLGSFFEAWINVAIGFGINFAANLLILPMFGFAISIKAWIDLHGDQRGPVVHSAAMVQCDAAPGSVAVIWRKNYVGQYVVKPTCEVCE